MAKIVCSNSGVEFQCEHLPLSLSSREISHPIFHIPKKKLLALSGQWAAGRLSATENYLLYLSLLGSTDLIEWRTPAIYHERTQQIIANNMEQLIHIIGRVDAVSHPSLVLPHFVIGYETRTLENSYHWIQVWIQNYNDWYDNVKSHANDQELTRRENSLNKLIKTSHKRIEDYPRILANWASVAGDFPTFTVKVKGISMSCSEYWESLIIKCANANTAFGIPSADLNELIEHCEDEIEGEGSIFSRALMKHLRAGREMAQNYLGLPPDLGFSGRELTSYRFVSPEGGADAANVQNMIDSAPSVEPKEKDYPNKISYLKAKGRWIQKEHALTQLALRAEEDKK